jgi:hypothetical protein
VSNDSDDDLSRLSLSETAMGSKLEQVSPEIWMNLSSEAKKWLLNWRKRQKQEYEKTEKSLAVPEHNAHTTLSICKILYNKCINMRFLTERCYTSILDGLADARMHLRNRLGILFIHN